ncbi:metal-dependent hydrolase [Candidatus Fukatsuia anoeciicola]|uniref:metal-dependent hydrolase n=1 Tax=Candidatus Fukatsuia anoeciicola TaxID=2994492 RepID=UPI003464A38C
MTGKGHLIFSISCVIFAQKARLTPALTQGDWWHTISAALLTSLLPDIDHPSSIIGQQLKWISLFMAKLFGHRGFTHSLLAVFSSIILIRSDIFTYWFFLPDDVLHAMIIGYFSHLLADMLTPAGIPLLWPFRWRFCVPLLNSSKNNQSEYVFCILLLGCALFWQSDTIIIIIFYIKQLRAFIF